MLTESGYYTAPQSTMWGGVNRDVQAKETLNLLLDAARYTVAATYVYELLDHVPQPAGNDREASFGLFEGDGRPKPAAVALHDMLTILQAGIPQVGIPQAGIPQPGTSARPPASLGYSVRNLPATGHSLLLAKGPDRFDLVIWNEARLWDEPRQAELHPPATRVVLDLCAARPMKLFDPLVGTDPMLTQERADHLPLELGDHALIVEVEPDGAPAASDQALAR